MIKSTFETSHIPVILLTSLCDKSDQLEGLGLGAEDYITKPFDISLLEQRIKSLMRNREIVREKALKLIKPENDEQQVILANELNDQFVKKAVEVIHNNMQNLDFDKESFAMEMHVSGSLLYKKIKDYLSTEDSLLSVYHFLIIHNGNTYVRDLTSPSAFLPNPHATFYLRNCEVCG